MFYWTSEYDKEIDLWMKEVVRSDNPNIREAIVSKTKRYKLTLEELRMQREYIKSSTAEKG